MMQCVVSARIYLVGNKITRGTGIHLLFKDIIPVIYFVYMIPGTKYMISYSRDLRSAISDL